MGELTEQQVLALIEQAIRDHYCMLRTRAQRISEFNPPVNYDIYFRAAAEMCVKHGVSPMEFIEVQFQALKPYPKINELSTARAMERFNEKRPGAAARIAQQADVQFTALKELMGVHGSDLAGITRILLDPLNRFDKLFTFLIASNTPGLEHLAEDTKRAATAQYMTSVYYDKVYEGYMPDEFIALARKMRKEAMNGV